ncbi:hypothetical protein CAEBREN_03774 [Caenorhabditis brenneri]|uniref:Uncharacterized protein n=1 Tax=Caenorhabditis brenneri TaxID=135651 RepID=G0MVC3_CAEBE|nr:hypothetical protein CAEBREN_03774 [Caenorhabditis brenneri]
MKKPNAPPAEMFTSKRKVPYWKVKLNYGKMLYVMDHALLSLNLTQYSIHNTVPKKKILCSYNELRMQNGFETKEDLKGKLKQDIKKEDDNIRMRVYAPKIENKKTNRPVVCS